MIDDLEIYPRGTFTEEDSKWRESLKVGDEVDACDKFNHWYKSTILEVSEETVLKDEENENDTE